MYYSWYVVDSFDPWTIVAWLIVVIALHGVWRVWRGMKLDSFQRSIRTLRQQPQQTIRFQHQMANVERASGGVFQIRLLPLMLISTAVAVLLAQAQRPDDTSRAFTWSLFVGIGTWYGTSLWTHRRGIGPLRNCSWSGVASAMGISVVLWTFYLVVDLWHGDPGYHRISASFPTLLWWTAVGGVAGGIIGAWTAARIYARVTTDIAPSHELSQDVSTRLAIAASPRTRRIAWTTLTMACVASALFHLSAIPHLHRVVHYRYWNWSHYAHDWRPSLTLMMDSVETPGRPAADLDILLAPNHDGHDHNDVMQAPTTELYSGDQSSDYRIEYVSGMGYPTGPVVLTQSLEKGQQIKLSMLAEIDPQQYAAQTANRQIAISRAQQLVGMYANETIQPGPVTVEQVRETSPPQLNELADINGPDLFLEDEPVNLSGEREIRGPGDAGPGAAPAPVIKRPATAGALVNRTQTVVDTKAIRNPYDEFVREQIKGDLDPVLTAGDQAILYTSQGMVVRGLVVGIAQNSIEIQAGRERISVPLKDVEQFWVEPPSDAALANSPQPNIPPMKKPDRGVIGPGPGILPAPLPSPPEQNSAIPRSPQSESQELLGTQTPDIMNSVSFLDFVGMQVVVQTGGKTPTQTLGVLIKVVQENRKLNRILLQTPSENKVFLVSEVKSIYPSDSDIDILPPPPSPSNDGGAPAPSLGPPKASASPDVPPARSPPLDAVLTPLSAQPGVTSLPSLSSPPPNASPIEDLQQ